MDNLALGANQWVLRNNAKVVYRIRAEPDHIERFLLRELEVKSFVGTFQALDFHETMIKQLLGIQKKLLTQSSVNSLNFKAEYRHSEALHPQNYSNHRTPELCGPEHVCRGFAPHE